MSLAIVHSRAQLGIDAPVVTVEVHLTNGLPSLAIVGLPAAAVKESKDRVRSALLNSCFEYPMRRITVNLAPADLPKEGGRYDLAIAIGILAASGQVPNDALEHYEMVGELALSGAVRATPGTIPAAIACASTQRSLIIPSENASEAAIVGHAKVLCADHLLAVCRHLHNQEKLHQVSIDDSVDEPPRYPDLSEVKGQHQAKRALEIAAAGNHSILFSGPPGTGKTMLASRLPGILPPLSLDERLEVASIKSITNQQDLSINHGRPFRSPHHTASAVSLVGGGSWPKPGEISLAHKGVLFLDELPEFDRKVLEVMREPLESGQICISRASRQVTFPASFQLIAAMNPCPCGHHGDPNGRCQCSPDKVRRYQSKISGPLLDRLDLHITVPPLQQGELSQKQPSEASFIVAQRVSSAVDRQLQRRNKMNSRLTGKEVEDDCRLTADNQTLVENAIQRLQMSVRAYHRILRVARTIADLSGEDTVQREHLMEAISYRKQEKFRG